MTILPLAYLPSVEYFAHLLRGGGHHGPLAASAEPAPAMDSAASVRAIVLDGLRHASRATIHSAGDQSNHVASFCRRARVTASAASRCCSAAASDAVSTPRIQSGAQERNVMSAAS